VEGMVALAVLVALVEGVALVLQHNLHRQV
jgi:hypothetical protein